MQFKLITITALAATCINGITSTALARGATPYLPLHIAPEIERAVERVLILGGHAITKRPIAATTVLNALPEACRVDRPLCTQVQNYLERYMPTANITHVGLQLTDHSGSKQALTNQHGATTHDTWQGQVVAFWQPGDFFLLNAGVVADQNNTTPTGTFLSLGSSYAQLDVGYRDHWLSPFTDSSTLISTQAATLPSITLSNYAPLSALHLSYELFLSRMERSNVISYQNELTTGSPRLAGIQLAIEPVAGWSLAVSRLMQYGGGARGGNRFNDLLQAFFRPHSYDNVNDTLSTDEELGNQTAALSSRVLFPGQVPMAVYFEYAGEDTSYGHNYRLGNVALSAGIDLPRLGNHFDATYEVSEWQNGWYTHHIYGDGLTNEGHVIGHWFGDARQANDAVGGRSHMLRVGWTSMSGSTAELYLRTLQNEHYTGFSYRDAYAITARYAKPIRHWLLGTEVTAGRDVLGKYFSGVSGFARFTGDVFTSRGNNIAIDTADTDEWLDYFIDVGSSASRVRKNIADGSPITLSDFSYAPHLGIGARRAVTEFGDLGSRIEFDHIDGASLFTVRAVDYRYRFRNPLAFTAFIGAARYQLATPAFGYYLGVGAQWRNVLPRYDLCLDFRYGDRIARDKLLPNDPGSKFRPDMFFDITGTTLYLSRRW